MPLIEWTSDLELGIQVVDADHKVLVKLLNQVDQCIETNEESFILNSILNALVDYTYYHFRREEKLQELCGYPGLSQHKESHSKLEDEVNEVRHRFENENDAVSAQEIRDFLKRWLVDHILVEDFSYKGHCNADSDAIAAAEAIPLYECRDDMSAPTWEELSVLIIDDNLNFQRKPPAYTAGLLAFVKGVKA